MKTVTAPGEGKPDITMSYAGKRAITIHKAPPGVEVSDPLDLAIPTAPVTIQAVDGLGQPVWTAKTAVVDGAPTYAVANRALKDGLGRPRVAGLVQAVSFAALASLVTADASPALFAPTRTDVDDKDRPTYVYEPQAAPSEASRVSRKEYSAANGRLRTDAYDAKNNHTATVQDSAGNTVEVWEYNGAEIGTVTYVFDALKQVTRIEDAERPNPNVTTITYDGLGRQSSVTTPDTGTTTFEYDSVGRLKKKIDARGKEVVNNYEPGSSRVVSITRTGETRDYTFTYGLEGDANRATGRILRSQDEDGEETYVYNALGATTKITRKLLTDEVFETTFDYDSFNRVRSITYPDGEVVQYQYDAAGQVRHAASAQALYVSSILYDEFGQRKTVTYGNGVVETFAIEPNTRRVTGIKSGTFQSLTLEYDDVNNITSISDPGTLTRTLDYDALNRLTSDTMRVTMGDGSYKQHISTFTFDKLHRMRKQVQTVTTDINPTGTTESHDWTYEYTRTPHAVSGITGDATPFVYQHDAAGNMEDSKQGNDERTITWTADGFERRHQRGTSVTEYFYDSNAQRRAKNTDGAVTHYLGPHATKSALGLSKHVFVGQQRVATAIGNNRVFYHTDHIGTTSLLTDKDGVLKQKVWLYTYGGEFHHVDGTSLALVDQRFLLTGKEWDAESGDYYFGWRYLAPDIAAWRSADPEWMKQGPAGLNLYHVMGGNPVRVVDPDGRSNCAPFDFSCMFKSGNEADERAEADWRAPVGFAQSNTRSELEAIDAQNGEDLASGLSGVSDADQGQLREASTAIGGVTRTVGQLAQGEPVGAAMEAGGTALQMSAAKPPTGKATAVAAAVVVGAVVASRSPGSVMKSVNRPAWGKITVDVAHVMERHSVGGALSGVAGRTVFPATMNEKGIMRAIKGAYKSSTVVETQGERVLLHGRGSGLTIEMWFNRTTKQIETAYTVGQ